MAAQNTQVTEPVKNAETNAPPAAGNELSRPPDPQKKTNGDFSNSERGNKEGRLDRARFFVECATAAAVIVALIFSYLSVERAADAVEASNEQLEGTKYQSVYDRQLSLWSLAAEEPEVAPYIVGGQPVPELGAIASPEARRAHARATAAVYATLDFYAYVYEQLAPSWAENAEGFVPLATPRQPHPANSEIADKRQLQEEWEGWISWSSTIRAGLAESPSACHNLLIRSADDYEPEFRDAVRASGAC